MYAKVALNLPINKLFTYSIPEYLIGDVSSGKRVVVNFGRKVTTAIIVSVSKISVIEKIKPIQSVLDEEPVVTEKIFSFGEWMSEYYLSTLGECLFLSIPRNTNIRSENYYRLSDDYIRRFDKFKHENEIYVEIIEEFERSGDPYLSKQQILKKLRTDSVDSLLNNLIGAGIVQKHLLYKKPTRAKLIKFYSRNFAIEDIDTVIRERKVRSQKQQNVLRLMCDVDKISKKDLIDLTGITSPSLDSLVLKNLINVKEDRYYRINQVGFRENQSNIKMNTEQEEAFNEVVKAIESQEFGAFLLHGVTGSGKTEVYLNIIEKVLSVGKTAIVLVPEISLTPQLINRFGNRFNNRVGVIHSRLSDGEKLDTFDSIRNGNVKIIIGARSALFAPFENLGIIIVDEEHDASYKQENSPRYNARDAAIVKAKIFNCPVVLGSATPSIESYYNALSGKYKLLQLTKRPEDIKQPEIKIIDLARKDKESFEEYVNSQSNKVKFDFFDFIDKVRLKFLSKELILEIDTRLDRKESIILLQNRRGFHSYTECINCRNVEMCPRCSVSLTYHKSFQSLKCHFCGFHRNYTGLCSQCGSERLIPKGAGTERVEEEIALLFPKAVVERMDSDAVSSKRNFKRILQDFYDGKIDILVGTQMISKGLDFPNVTLVGVVNADIGLLNPDFRATERTFQILTQVAGRSGRSLKRGEVVIQTNHGDYHVFKNVKEHDYNSFFQRELTNREELHYPPFSRLVLIELKSDDRNLTESKTKEIFNLIAKLDKNKIADVLPPNQPLFSKLKDKHRYHLLMKCSKKKDPGGSAINSVLRGIRSYAEKNFPSKLQLTIDVDAVNLL